jgi:hypothetical protein
MNTEDHVGNGAVTGNFLFDIQTGSGAQPASYLMGNWGVKLTTYLHLLSRLRMRGVILPLQKVSSLCDALLSAGNTLY